MGAGYLLFLAWQAFRLVGVPMDKKKSSEAQYWRLITKGVILNVANAKVVIFFPAFLAQFTDPMRSDLTLQLLFLGVLFMLSTLVIFVSITLKS